MRLPLLPILVIVAINILIDWYIFNVCRRRLTSKFWSRLHLTFSVLMSLVIVVAVCLPYRSGGQDMLLADMWLIYSYATVFLPKMAFFIFDILARLPQLFHRFRLKWLSSIGCGIAIATFVAMWWGALINRLDYQVKEVEVDVCGLPESFDGYRILHFSDFHVGTYGDDTTFVAKIVNAVNENSVDLIAFTGDIVNREATELIPFVATLSRMRANDGVMAILGNHDYGEYKSWESGADKLADKATLVKCFDKMGWRLLLNETEMIHRGGDSIAVIGVENIGDPPFKVYGDLDKAYPNSSDSITKILLSHTPVHWVCEIKNNPFRNIALTLSGHTHAMQLELLGISPAALRYPTWGGLYSDDEGRRHLYVNIGLGTVGIPARIGATPELTIITLRKAR